MPVTKHSLPEAPKERENRNKLWQNKRHIWNHSLTKNNCNRRTASERSIEKLPGTILPVSILYKSIADRYRPVSYPDGPITARYRFIKNASGLFLFDASKKRGWVANRIDPEQTCLACVYKVCITKTCLYNFDPLKPHFYIVKLGFTGVYIIFLISEAVLASTHNLWFEQKC